jgi:hypothetical protein
MAMPFKLIMTSVQMLHEIAKLQFRLASQRAGLSM